MRHQIGASQLSPLPHSPPLSLIPLDASPPLPSHLPFDTCQAAVFEEVSDLVQSALDGFKVCLFSYGQTGAGKTHTMQGSRSFEGQGIIPRAIAKVRQRQGWETGVRGRKREQPGDGSVGSRDERHADEPEVQVMGQGAVWRNGAWGKGSGHTQPPATRLPITARLHQHHHTCVPIENTQVSLPPAVEQILESVVKLRDQGWDYRLEASFIEVYNEQLRDLLAEPVPGRREAGKIHGGWQGARGGGGQGGWVAAWVAAWVAGWLLDGS